MKDNVTVSNFRRSGTFISSSSFHLDLGSHISWVKVQSMRGHV